MGCGCFRAHYKNAGLSRESFGLLRVKPEAELTKKPKEPVDGSTGSFFGKIVRTARRSSFCTPYWSTSVDASAGNLHEHLVFFGLTLNHGGKFGWRVRRRQCAKALEFLYGCRGTQNRNDGCVELIDDVIGR